MLRFWLICLSMLPIVHCNEGCAAGYLQVPGVIHMDSAVSGGELGFDELAGAAEEAGAAFAIVTDHDTQLVEYGIPPLRSILKISQRQPAIHTYGAGRYLDDISAVNAAHPDLMFMAGVEAVPFYAWEQRREGMSLRHFHRHLLVLGIDDPAVIEGLPSLETGYPRRMTMRNALGAAWIVPLLWSLGFMLKRGVDGRRRRLRLTGGLPVFLVSAAFLANGWPYTAATIDQYHGDAGAAPYQAVIDHVNRAGGLAFWAHPEAAYRETAGDSGYGSPLTAIAARLFGGELTVETEPYEFLLNDTRDYTGFAIFNEGRETLGAPGGLWDSLLMQYCGGARARPVWAIAELDMESRGIAGAAGECMTVALTDERTPTAVLDALRHGRMYCFAAFYAHKVQIVEYAVVSGDRRAGSGDTLAGSDDARLVLDMTLERDTPELEVVTVRDGDIISRERIDSSSRLNIPIATSDAMSYVRVMAYDRDGMQIALNPIFLAGEDAE